LPEGASLVLHGEAGVGKSALLRSAAAQARAAGMTVVSAAGVQSDVAVPFTGLLQLLWPLLEDGRLPSSARATIRGLTGGSPTRLVPPVAAAMAALDLLTTQAARSPVLVMVDDAQWVDASTWDALVFVSRRVAFDGVLLLAALRDGVAAAVRLEQARLPSLRIGPLGEHDAAALLAARFPGLPGPLARQVLQRAGGNPLGLLELGAAAGRQERSENSETRPLPDRLARMFAAAAADLPPPTRELLLAAALDDEGALGRVTAAAAAASGIPVTSTDLEPAITARLAQVDEHNRIQFRHPLIRSAIGQTASLEARGRVHLALAALLPVEDDRSTWHRAAAAAGADSALAGELADLGMRARARGALTVAVRALERSAQLTANVRDRSSRLFGAVETAYMLGDHDAAARLGRDINPGLLPLAERLQLDWINEVYVRLSWTGARHLPGFAEAIDRIRVAGDDDLALSALESIGMRVWWSDADQAVRDQFLAVAERLCVPRDDPRLIFALAHIAPVDRGAELLGLLKTVRVAGEANPELQHLLGIAAVAVGALEDARAFLASAVAGLRERGELGELGRTLLGQTNMAVQSGDARLAAVAAAEARPLLAETNQPLWVLVADLGRAEAAALRGDGEAALELAGRTETELLQLGAHVMLAVVQLIRGIAALAGGRFAESYSQLRRIFDPVDPAYHPFIRFWAVGFLAEAAAHADRQAEASELLSDLAHAAERGQSPSLRAGLAYAAGLLAPAEQAGELFLAALDRPTLTLPWERGRVHLAYGTWLRRRRQLVAARDQLRTAQSLLDGLGVTPWADRARQELRATGETIRRPSDAADRLTPQELQIALLAADGLSNRAIAEQLYLSPRTVSTHLYRVFPKLGVTGRAELPRVLSPLRQADN
jgi:DNA-binding CsgD family transcriptional regulator